MRACAFTVIVLGLALACAGCGQRLPPEQEAVVDELRKLGAVVSIDFETTGESDSEPQARLHVDLRQSHVADADLARLTALPSVVSLALGSDRYTDAALEHVSALADLTTLDLAGTRITDEGIAHIVGLPKLRRLYLSKTRITDAALPSLKQMTQLEFLWLQGTRLSERGLDELDRTLHNTRITH